MEIISVGEEVIDLDTFLSSFCIEGGKEIIDLEDVKIFCSIRSVNRLEGFISQQAKTDVQVEKTYFPILLIQSIQKILESGHLVDEDMRFYIWAVGIVASLSEEYTNFMIENSIFPIFFAILDIHDVYLCMTKRHVFMAMQRMLCSPEIIEKVNLEFDFFNSLDQSIHQFWDLNDFNVPLKILASVCRYIKDIKPIADMCVEDFMHFLKNGNSISKYDSIIGVKNLLTTDSEITPLFIEQGIISACDELLSVTDTNVIEATLDIILIIASDKEAVKLLDYGDLARKIFLLLLQSEQENRKKALKFILNWHRIVPIEMNLFLFSNNRIIKEICSYEHTLYDSRVLSTRILIYVFLNYPNELVDVFLENGAFEYLFDMIDETDSTISSDILECFSFFFSRRMDFTAYELIDGFKDKLVECVDNEVRGAAAAQDILDRCFVCD